MRAPSLRPSAHVLPVILLLMLFAVVASGQTLSPITVRTELVVPSDIERTGQELVLAGIGSSTQDQLSVRWTRVDGGWFPYWVLRLTSEAGVVNVNGTELATVTPVPGNTYHTTFSWDPGLGAVSIQVTDATSNRILHSAGMAVTSLAGGGREDSSPSVRTNGTLVAALDQYVPMGLRWEPGVRVNGSFTTTRRFERDDESLIRIDIPGPVPEGGEFLLLANGYVELGRTRATANVVELPFEVSELSIGPSEVALVYAAADERLATWTQAITLGNVSARYDEVLRNPGLGAVSSFVRLESASNLPGVDVTVRAHISEIQWDQESRRYQEIPRATYELVSQTVDIPAGVTALPLSFETPDSPGIWKVTFESELRPEVLQFDATTPYYFSTYAPAEITPGDSYTVVVLPDTQYYAQTHPHIFMRQTEWIAANTHERNIGLVLHMGDITNANTWEQWRVAANSMKLLNHVVPYVLAVGNHDNFPEGRGNGQTARRGDSRINAFFFPDEFPHLGGLFEPGKLENAYYTVNIAGTDYLILSLEFAPSDEMVAWGDQVVAAHPNHEVIVVTHMYTGSNGRRTMNGQIAGLYDIGRNPDTTVNDGQAIWEKFVRKHANIRFVFSGHIHSPVIPYDAAVGDHGNTVYEVLMDYQSEEFGGNGYLVLWEFHPDGRVDVQAYSPYLDQVKSEVAGRFGNVFSLLLEMPLVGVER